MAQKVTTPDVEDVASVGTRISWGAIFAGCLLALAMQFLLGILGGAVGVSVGDRVRTDSLWTGALIWVIVTTCASLFVGGVVTSMFTVGENKIEAVMYGVIMWALLVTGLLALGATGVRAGLTGMVQVVNAAQNTSGETWAAAAKRAGIDEKTIESWEKQISTKVEGAAKDVQNPETKEAIAEAGKKATWYTFGGIWISMLAAAAGAWVGAGPTFRLVRVI